MTEKTCPMNQLTLLRRAKLVGAVSENKTSLKPYRDILSHCWTNLKECYSSCPAKRQSCQFSARRCNGSHGQFVLTRSALEPRSRFGSSILTCKYKRGRTFSVVTVGKIRVLRKHHSVFRVRTDFISFPGTSSHTRSGKCSVGG